MLTARCTYIPCDTKKRVGTKDPDYIEGTDDDDYKLVALKDCDAVFGRDGDDKLYGDQGDDALGDSGNGIRTERVDEIEDCISRDEGGSESVAAYMQQGATLLSGDPVEVLGRKGGQDKFYGERGDDEIQAAGSDHDRDLVDCGPGKDTAFVDEGLGKVVDCEIINPPNPEQGGGP